MPLLRSGAHDDAALRGLTRQFAQELVWLYERVEDTDPDICEEFRKSAHNAQAYLIAESEGGLTNAR